MIIQHVVITIFFDNSSSKFHCRKHLVIQQHKKGALNICPLLLYINISKRSDSNKFWWQVIFIMKIRPSLNITRNCGSSSFNGIHRKKHIRYLHWHQQEFFWNLKYILSGDWYHKITSGFFKASMLSAPN